MKKHILISVLTMVLGACTTIPDVAKLEPPPARLPDLQSQTPINSPEIKAPAWVLKGGGAFTGDEEDRSFYGVGSATGIKYYSLDTRSLNKDYLSHTTAGDFTATSEEQHSETAIKTLTASTVSGIVIVDHWEHPYRNELFSLAKLDLEWFKRNVDQYKELSKDIREAIKESADKLHRELEEELLNKRKEHFEEMTSSKEKLFEEQRLTMEKEKELLTREKDQLKEEKEFVEKQTEFLGQIENHMVRPSSRNPSTEGLFKNEETAFLRKRPSRVRPIIIQKHINPFEEMVSLEEKKLLERDKRVLDQTQKTERIKLPEIVKNNEDTLEPQSIEEMSFIEPPEKTDFEKKWQGKEPLTSNSKWWKSVFY